MLLRISLLISAYDEVFLFPEQVGEYRECEKMRLWLKCFWMCRDEYLWSTCERRNENARKLNSIILTCSKRLKAKAFLSKLSWAFRSSLIVSRNSLECFWHFSLITCLLEFSRCLRAISSMTRCRRTSKGFTIDSEGLVRFGEKYFSWKCKAEIVLWLVCIKNGFTVSFWIETHRKLIKQISFFVWESSIGRHSTNSPQSCQLTMENVTICGEFARDVIKSSLLVWVFRVSYVLICRIHIELR